MLERIEARDAVLLVIDVQDKLMAAMHDAAARIEAVRRMLQAAAVLELPIVATEHYPQGLGRMVPGVGELLPAGAVFEKVLFSACTEPVLARLRELHRRQVILVGVEAHVCVLQTLLDLLRRGFRVVVCADAVTSRRVSDAEVALHRMRQAGAVVTTTESIIYELLGGADNPLFRAILKIVK